MELHNHAATPRVEVIIVRGILSMTLCAFAKGPDFENSSAPRGAGDPIADESTGFAPPNPSLHSRAPLVVREIYIDLFYGIINLTKITLDQ